MKRLLVILMLVPVPAMAANLECRIYEDAFGWTTQKCSVQQHETTRPSAQQQYDDFVKGFQPTPVPPRDEPPDPAKSKPLYTDIFK